MAVIITSKQEGYSIVTGIIAAILMAIGLYFLIWGIGIQLASAVIWNWWALLYYLVAIVLIGIGKHLCIASLPSK